MKQQAYNILFILVTIASFIPFLIVAWKKLWHSRPFLLFACYWALSGLINLMDRIPGISNADLETITVVYNMFDVPLVLAMIHFTSGSVRIRRFTRVAAPALLLLELINFFTRGFHYDAAKYMVGTGLFLVILCLGWEISNYVQKLEHTELEKAQVFLHASLLFAYGTFIIIYIFDYYVRAGSSIDNFLIYYVSCLIATLIASVGYFSKGAAMFPGRPAQWERFRGEE